MWYYNIDKEGIAISSRVRFARNLNEYRYPHLMDEKDAENLAENMNDILGNGSKLLKLNDIDDVTLNSLVERHLISKEFILDKHKKALLLNERLDLVVMINEEDHLRIQGFAPSLNIMNAYKIAKDAEEKIGEKLEYASHEQFGYLTACPTNVGSGLRISVMLHLPALTKLGYMSKLLGDAATLGIAVRGVYGENTKALGDIYQISNQRTLGVSDEEIINNIEKISTNIINQEKKARKMLEENMVDFEDKIMRALGILKYARKIDTKEAEEKISYVRLGIERGIIKDVDINKLQKISVNIKPNMLKLEFKKDMDEIQRDEYRANYIRKELN